MTLSDRRVVIGLGALLVLQVGAFAAWQKWFHHDVAIASASGVIPQMHEFTRQRRYDDAVQLGLKSASAAPGDYNVLQEIALVYLRQAQVESGDHESPTREATGYADKALAVNPHHQTNLYDSARVFEIAGDFSTAMKCTYYGRSSELFQQRQPLVEGLSEAVKKEQEFLSGRVKAKMEKNGCR